MNRQLNARFLAVLLLTATAVGVGAYFAHGYQVRRNAGYLLAKGEEAEKNQKDALALSYFARYLALRPDDARARGRHGTLQAKSATTKRAKERAYLTLERALRDDPELIEFHETAAELAMDLGRYGDGKDHLETLLKNRVNDPKLTDRLGQCLEATGKLAEAAKHFEKVIVADPHRVEAYTRLAAVYRRQDQPDKADDAMTRLVKQNPDSVLAGLASVRYYRDHGAMAKAKESLQVLQTKSAGEKDVLLASADLAMVDGDLKAARGFFADGRKKHPDEPQFTIGLADLELRDGHRTEAVALLRAIAAAAPNRSPYLWAIADYLISADEPVDAKKLVARLRKEDADPAAVDFLDARLLLGEGKARKAEVILQRCRKEFDRNPDFALRTELLLAACYERLEKPDLRLAACQAALRMSPVSVSVKAAHADAVLAKGDVEEALKLYHDLKPRIPEVRLTIARIGIWQQSSRPAASPDWTAVAEVLDQAPVALKTRVGYHLARAELLLAQGKAADATKLIEAARDKAPTEVALWLFLAQAAARAGEAKDGLAVLDQAQAKVGDRVALRLARAAFLTSGAADPAALRAIEQGAEKFPDTERNQLLLGLADAHVRAKSPADAERLLRQLADRLPGDTGVLARLFDAIAPKEDPAAIEDLIAKLRSPDAEGEDGAMWRFAEAYLLWVKQVKQLGTDDARRKRLLAEAASRRPQWYRVPLLEGQIAESSGQVDVAIEKYRQAIRLGARNPDVARRAASLLMARRRYDDVRQLIDEVRSTAPSAASLAKFETTIAALRGADADRTAELTERSVSATSTDYRDHLWRGQVLAAVGKTKDAEAAFRRAVELAPTAPEAWVGLVVFLKQTDRPGEAKAAVESAGRAVPAEKKAQVWAPCLEAVGERAEAEKQYAELLKQSPGDPAVLRAVAMFYVNGGDLPKAKPYFDALIGTPGAAAVDARTWARRVYAIALAASGDYKSGTEALAQIEQNLKEAPGNPEDVRAQALVFAVRPGGRRQAIKFLETSFAMLRPTPAEEFNLACMYELDGEWPKASAYLATILAGRGGENLDSLAYYVRKLLKYDDLPGALAWLARLEARDKDPLSPRTVELRARVLIKQNRKADAGDLIKRYAQTVYAEKKNPTDLSRAGRLLNELGLLADAEEMLRRYVGITQGMQPAVALILSDFLASHDRVAEALTVCSDALTNKANPELVGNHTVIAVRLGDGSADHAARAEAILQRAIQAAPKSVDLQISLAELRDAQARYDEAKQMYRALLQQATRDQLNVVLNNLAWLLAIQEGNLTEADAVIGRAIEEFGQDGNLLDTRGVIRMLSGQTALAVKDLTEAVAQQPIPIRHFHLAQAHQKAGNAIEAQREMGRARDAGLTKKDLHVLEWKHYEPMLALIVKK